MKEVEVDKVEVVEEEKEKVTSEKVNFVQCDDSKSAKFRNSDNELLNIKFIGITVPEKVEDDTYEYLNSILNKAQDITIEYDENLDKDSYGRTYAWVFVDDLLLQDILIKEGYANISSEVATYKYSDLLKESLKEAKDNELGIWAKEEEKIEEVKEEIKEEKKGFFKQITASIVNFFDSMIESLLKMIESML